MGGKQTLSMNISIPQVQFKGSARPGPAAAARISIPQVQFKGAEGGYSTLDEVNFNSTGPIQGLSCVSVLVGKSAISIPQVQFKALSKI